MSDRKNILPHRFCDISAATLNFIFIPFHLLLQGLSSFHHRKGKIPYKSDCSTLFNKALIREQARSGDIFFASPCQNAMSQFFHNTGYWLPSTENIFICFYFYLYYITKFLFFWVCLCEQGWIVTMKLNYRYLDLIISTKTIWSWALLEKSCVGKR